MTQTITTHRLANGMTVIIEPMAQVASASFVFMFRPGAAMDAAHQSGSASLLSEWLFRGAGDLDNRQLNDRLDSLGLQHDCGAGRLFTTASGALVANNLPEALDLHAAILQSPHLSDEHFPLCRDLAVQGIESLDDDPRQKIMMLAYEHYFDGPLGNRPCGTIDDLNTMNADTIRSHYRSCLRPDQTILAVAGGVDADTVIGQVESVFGDWSGTAPAPAAQPPHRGGMFHHHHDGAQVHIALLYPAVHSSDPDYYNALAASAVLSGGMGSRLFTEVREKRGLCYAVMAAMQVVGSAGVLFAYAGSSPDKAQETLDVMTDQCLSLADGISDEEMDRARVGLRASLIMQGEATGARAAGCAGDYIHLGRVRPLEEIDKAISTLTAEGVVDFARRHRPESQNLCVTTIGPRELTMPSV